MRVACTCLGCPSIRPDPAGTSRLHCAHHGKPIAAVAGSCRRLQAQWRAAEGSPCVPLGRLLGSVLNVNRR